ncbi:MAG: archaellin/type IV pilin N-terminal domain-containing protein [Nanobdellota archaeon]
MRGESIVLCRRSQSSMGAIIIFIAAIFVAAIAAGVLIQTSSSLTSKALATGGEAKKRVSTSLVVREIYGNDGTTDSLDKFYIDLQITPGSNGIKLSNLMLQFETTNSSDSYSYNEEVSECDASSVPSGKFNIAYLLNSSSSYTSGYINPGDVAQICFNTQNIIEGKKLLFKLIPKNGQETIVTTSSPNTYSKKNVVIYP